MTEVEYLKPSAGLTPLMKACLIEDEKSIIELLKENVSGL